MADVKVMTIDELESAQTPGVPEGIFRFAGKSLGVSAWGMNVLSLPAGWDRYPEHDHEDDGHEEVYVVLEGSAVLHSGQHTFDLVPGTLARVAPQARRKIVPGASGVVLLALGGTPGKPYAPSWGRTHGEVPR